MFSYTKTILRNFMNSMFASDLLFIENINNEGLLFNNIKKHKERSRVDRRSKSDRRKKRSYDYFAKDMRRKKDRRINGEQRDDWSRTGEWSSEFVGSSMMV